MHTSCAHLTNRDIALSCFRQRNSIWLAEARTVSARIGERLSRELTCSAASIDEDLDALLVLYKTPDIPLLKRVCTLRERERELDQVDLMFFQYEHEERRAERAENSKGLAEMASKRARSQEAEITAKSILHRALLNSTLLLDSLAIGEIEAALKKANPNRDVDPCVCKL